jgi:hypothetical protein
MPHLDEITKVYPEMAGNGWRYRIDADKTIATLTSQGVELRYRQKDFWRIVKQQTEQPKSGGGFVGFGFPI